MRTHSWRLTVAAALALAAPGLILTTTGAAGAQTISSASPPAARPLAGTAVDAEPDQRRDARGKRTVTTLRQLNPGKVGRPSWSRSEAESAETRARQRIIAREARRGLTSGAQSPDGGITPLDDPSHHVSDCQEESFSAQRGGFVIDHFRYCEVTFWEVETTICTWRTWFGCWNRKEVSHAEFRMTTAGYGYDRSMYDPGEDEWDPDFNEMHWVTALDQWKNVRGAAGAETLTIGVTCAGDTPESFCLGDPLADPQTMTIAEWMTHRATFTRWLHDPAMGGDGPDNLTYFDFDTRITYAGTETSHTAGNAYRCDSAHYLRGGQGCMFHQVESLFPMSLSSEMNYRKAAQHKFDALFRPERTVPHREGKSIPGNPWADNDTPLERLWPDYDRSRYNLNRSTAIQACKDHWGDDYSQGGQFDCDEFPYASSYQGAGYADGHFSARVIDKGDNSSEGATLGNWYGAQRILHRDPYYVILTVPGSGGGGTPDLAPSVDAGPDTTGNEGEPILLRGTAADMEGAPATQWSYTAGPDVDPGARCEFSNAGAAATMVECSDDGTFTVTLSADDGVNESVSDSAALRVRNVAPILALAPAADTQTSGDGPTGPADSRRSRQTRGESGSTPAEIAGPEPWSVYRVGDPVPLTAPFEDPGSNDTQRCEVDWDDGAAPETYHAVDDSCSRSHVFPHAGMYTIELSVTDDDRDTDTSQTMVIVYDPDAGFPTGAGFLDSPSNALVEDPQAAGRLHLQLNPKYRPSDQGPSPSGGRVSARLKGADFTLRSDHLEWLVVTPDDKTAVKGTGRVNGRSGFGFVAYGYDEPDSFRLIVWPLSAGDIPGGQTTYDNRWRGHHDVDRATPQALARGSVQIHS